MLKKKMQPFDLLEWLPPEPQMRITEAGPIPRIVQAISYPFPLEAGQVQRHSFREGINIRAVPGDPTSLLRDIPLAELTPHTLVRWAKFYLHFAQASPSGTWASTFPTDMCRRDHCQPESPHLRIDADDMRFQPGDRISIVQISNEKKPSWTEGRWHSFGWKIASTQSILVRNGEWNGPV